MSIDPTDSRASADAQLILETLESVCSATGLSLAPVLTRAEGPYVEVDIQGDDAQEVFGEGGRVLDAFQYLTNLMTSRKNRQCARVLLDTCGYRVRRAALLRTTAQEYAAQVKELQQECEMDPLPPHERRIVHQVLSEDPDITTYSEGEEPDRRIIIAPRETAEG